MSRNQVTGVRNREVEHNARADYLDGYDDYIDSVKASRKRKFIFYKNARRNVMNTVMFTFELYRGKHKFGRQMNCTITEMRKLNLQYEESFSNKGCVGELWSWHLAEGEQARLKGLIRDYVDKRL